MTLKDAIDCRVSVRRYLDEPLSPDQCKQLEKAIAICNKRSGLHIQLICDQPEPFASIIHSYGMLKGVRHYLLFAGPKSDPHLEEKCGYFGEQIVLTATAMGLGTCWVGGTYARSRCTDTLSPEEKLVCVVAIGHISAERTVRENLISRFAKRKLRSVQELSSGALPSCQWFQNGMAAVQRAPSAMNRQGYRFIHCPDGKVQGTLTTHGPFSLVDLGIAKLHFELGAHGGTWGWGDGGIFQKAAEEKSCGAVIWREQDGGHAYLLVRHKGGHWSFPKGHVEENETEAETALREILEETGLDTQIDTSFREVVSYYPKPGVIKDVIFFLATPLGGTEQAQESEISQLGWFTFREARPLVTFATDEDVLLAAEARLSRKI